LGVTTPQALELELKPLRYRAMHLKGSFVGERRPC
jgi:hypothetical protein